MKKVRFRILENKLITESLAENIKKETAEAIIEVAKHLPIAEVDITLGHLPKNIATGIISGSSANKHEATIALNVRHRNFKKRLHVELPKVIAHELYHTVRTRKNKYPETLLEMFIEEGLAIHFELEVYGGEPPAYAVRLSDKVLRKTIEMARKSFYSTRFSQDNWFHGGNTKKIPRSAGYCIGYFLVKNMLEKNTQNTVSKLVTKKYIYFISKISPTL